MPANVPGQSDSLWQDRGPGFTSPPAAVSYPRFSTRRNRPRRAWLLRSCLRPSDFAITQIARGHCWDDVPTHSSSVVTALHNRRNAQRFAQVGDRAARRIVKNPRSLRPGGNAPRPESDARKQISPPADAPPGFGMEREQFGSPRGGTDWSAPSMSFWRAGFRFRETCVERHTPSSREKPQGMRRGHARHPARDISAHSSQ